MKDSKINNTIPKWVSTLFTIYIFIVALNTMFGGNSQDEIMKRESMLKKREEMGVTIKSIPSENKIELDKILEFQKVQGKVSEYIIEKDILYLTTPKQIYILNINDFKTIFSFEIPEEHISDSGEIIDLLRNENIFNNKAWDFNMKKIEMLLNSPVAEHFCNDILIHDDLVIFSESPYDIMYGKNYKTGKIIWKNDRGYKSGGIKFYGYRNYKYKYNKYKNRYLYENTLKGMVYEFNPKTGEIINEYPYDTYKLINCDTEHEYYMDFKNMEDKEFEKWLEEMWNKTDKGYLYTTYDSRFYFHKNQTTPLWMIEFPDDILETYNYGRYMFLRFSDSVTLLDFDNVDGEVIWSVNFEDGNEEEFIEEFIIHEERLHLLCADGLVRVFDLSKLEK
jgi:outer membrane protein assembly factor BamB